MFQPEECRERRRRVNRRTFQPCVREPDAAARTFPVAKAARAHYRWSMDSLDALTDPTPEGARSSPAARRNAAAILAVLKAHLPARGRVLEAAAGTGEHAVAFARALPGLDWTPSDPSDEALASIAAWRDAAGVANLAAPLRLDMVDETTWPGTPVDAVFCANMVHISPWAATEGLMRLAGRVLVRPGGLLALYGPFLQAEVETAPSNLAFDADLKARDPAWGLRAAEAVAEAAEAEGLVLTLVKPMPANNLTLLFRAV